MHIAIGEEIRRRELHAEYGGSPQGGISHSRRAPLVMCFTDDKKGAKYGYRDGWGEDGFFHYTGEGQEGDQKMARGNKAIHNHSIDQRELHLFEAVTSGVVSYRGRFELADKGAWYRSEAPDRYGDTRSVIVFRLRPLDSTAHENEAHIGHTPASLTVVSDIPLEQFKTSHSDVASNKEPTRAHRRESALLASYENYLKNQGHKTHRKKITPAGERRSLYTDLFDLTENLLIEAKGQATRESIRMAIGQLFDYQRYINPHPKLAILVPSRPRRDLRDLCAALTIQTIWPDQNSGQFHREPEAPTSG